MKIKGQIVSKGEASGEALVSRQAISFFGTVDLGTGKITEKGHDLYGKSISGKILVFPEGKGSTVGSFTLYRLKKGGIAPAGIIMREAEAIIASGAIISSIPLLHRLEKDPISSIKSGQKVKLDCNSGYAEIQ